MTLTAKDHRERVALFRLHILGPVLFRKMPRGLLKAELARLADTPFLPPGEDTSRRYAVPSLLRWRRAWLAGGLAALQPAPRADAGHGRALTEPQRQLVLDIRRDHPSVSAELIIDTLVRDGRLAERQISPGTLRRLFAQHHLFGGRTGPAHSEPRQRLPWARSEPNDLWHTDVCHGPDLVANGRVTRLRIHGVLDDASRQLIALEAHTAETEAVLLGLLVDALRREGRPDALYLDNGSTYRGDALAVACGRLGMGLIHARPYDPQARGKMERFWRTLRARCLDFVTPEHSLAEVQARLDHFAEGYRTTAHAGLLGKTPAEVYAARTRPTHRVTDTQLTDALTLQERRRVRQDSTLSLDGVLYEVGAAFLAGRIVTVNRCLLPGLAASQAATVEWEGRRLPLTPADPRRNATRRRVTQDPEPARTRVAFDPDAYANEEA